ncbi:MAG: hypothetical protein RhofKO_25090 [Rhodothermales bacterium]
MREGTGPLFYRTYTVRLPESRLSAHQVMERIQANIDRFAPGTVARFEKQTRPDKPLRVGDNVHIHIRGPWDGPVRVIDLTPTSFTLATLDGHLEAGTIQFEARDEAKGIVFSITSCARSSSHAVDLLYDKLKVIRVAQTYMWEAFCQNVADEAGQSVDVGDVEVVTQRTTFDPDTLTPDTLSWQQYQDLLAEVLQAEYNFDPDQRDTFTVANGWNLDEYEVDLPGEPSGEPIENGAWKLAQEWIGAYRFPEPRLVRGYYDPDVPLENRVMVLQAQFMGFEFLFGVRIEEVIDDVRETPDGPARVWGYSYRTLENHFEQGEIFFELYKYLKSGRVVFRIHSYSKAAHIANPLYRFGFGLFGRHLQKYFARQALKRTVAYVSGQLARQACRCEAGAIDPLLDAHADVSEAV